VPKKAIFALMHCAKTYVILAILAFAADKASAQVTKSARSARYGAVKVSRSKAMIMCPIFEESKYPYQGIGFKVGDPFALTYKFYPSKHWAFAVDAGKASSGLYNKYYRSNFDGYIPDTLGTSGEKSITYIAHSVAADWFLEAKFLYQWDAEKISKGLQLYVGAGWQWRNTSLDYTYSYNTGKGLNSIGQPGFFSKNRFTFGPVVLVGFEYSYFTLPVSAFIEVEMFTDTFLDPGYQRFQGGVGLRYVF
jgi:hypothetical protein